MNPIKVLGIGSPFGDDQVGWNVAEALKQHLSVYSDISTYVHIETIDRPGIRLIELIRTFNTVFLIDAVKSSSALGTIHQFTKEDIIDCAPRLSTHNISILQALHMANALNELPHQLLFYGVEINTVTLDATLSEHVESAVATLSVRLKDEIIRLVNCVF